MTPDFARLQAALRPVLLGALIAIAGIVPWQWLAALNAQVRPEWPWAATAMAAWLALGIAWLNGAGRPAGWRRQRHFLLRLWRPTPSAWSREGQRVTASLVALLAVLYVIWILGATLGEPPDLSAYPTTAYRISILVMGAVVSGVVEEVAFRGYMQSGLERLGAGTAIVVTSLVFALFHGVHGWQTLLLLGPGLFMASVLYGMLAYHTGSILPGMAIHVLGDLAHTFFGVLGGNAGLLVVAPAG